MFRTSSFSGPQGNCVEVEVGQGAVFVRDTKEAGSPQRGLLAFRLEAWQLFLDGGEGDVQVEETETQVLMRNRCELRDGDERQVLRFTLPEWEAFIAGCAAGEFDCKRGRTPLTP